MDVSIPKEFGSTEGNPLIGTPSTSYQSIVSEPIDEQPKQEKESWKEKPIKRDYDTGLRFKQNDLDPISSTKNKRYTTNLNSETVSLATQYTDDVYTSDEILFCLKYAHLHKGTNWVELIESVDGPIETLWSLQIKIRDNLANFPLSIQEKLTLLNYFKSKDVVKTFKSQKEPKRKKKRFMMRGFEFELWETKIKKIAAHFGSNVASYFSFLRFLFYVNSAMAVLMLVFVSLPQMIPGDSSIPQKVKGYFGVLSTSVLFYGAYNDDLWGTYDRPLAYFLTWISANFLAFIAIASKMYRGYYKTKKAGHSDEFVWAYRMFTSWDYSIASAEGVSDRQSSIKTDLKELLREEGVIKLKFGFKLIGIYIIRLFVNLFALCLLVGSGYLIYAVANETLIDKKSIPNFLADLFDKYELPITVAALKLVIPPLLCYLVHVEKWHPRTEIKLKIIKTALFYMASLIVLISSLYDVTSDCLSRTDNISLSQNVSSFCCWENLVGEELFKLVMVDLVVFIIVVLLMDGVRAILVRCNVWKFREWNFAHFDVVQSVLDLIYGQSLIWLGLFFSPFLTLVGALKLFVTFIFRYYTVRHFNNPPKNLFRVSRSGTFFVFILLISLFISLFPMIYAVITMIPSLDCGPYRLHEHVYYILTSRNGDLPEWLREIVVTLSTSNIIVPLLVFLLLAIMFYRAKIVIYSSIIKDIRDQLLFERKVEKKKIYRKAKVVKGIPLAAAE